ncbi:hypothetical protein [Phenylobacterium sp. J367]|uniref:hypothetical protein n=1 Tax=Phenylobacterium sp. J367 TaxID=2898435 RepID=UPI002151DA2C|nr:hypothetical protein [Phenylobacterium sp. J367]MCR5879535.1 hypothetical protein [Phenylobacterium sp. J367]
MSTKRPDVLVQPPSPLTALTLAEMHVRRWTLKATCNRCALKLRASLPALIRTHGPDAVWWGRAPRCPGFECGGGVLTYAAQALRGGSWVAMNQAPGQLAMAAYRSRNPTYAGPRDP